MRNALNLATLGLLALATGCSGGGASMTPAPAVPAAVGQSSLGSVGSVSAAKPSAIGIAPVAGSNVPVALESLDDGLSSRVVSAADDAVNVASADASALPPLDTPGAVTTDDDLRMAQQRAATTSGAIYYGTVYDSMSSNPLAGATITLGQQPDFTKCAASQSCGTPTGKLYKSTTNSSGAFLFNGIPTGQYMLVLTKNSAYAGLHALVNLHAGHFKTAFRLLALSKDEVAWVADVNHVRTTISYPRSFADMSVDQYAEIEARAWAASVVSGKTLYGDPGLGTFANAYSHQPGELYGATAVGALQYGTSQYLAADSGWMGEKANCPKGDWQTCPFKENTGHYMNLSNTDNVWIGVGETDNIENATMPWPGYSPYSVYEVMNTWVPGPA
jgi:hypothetical protein